MANIAPEKSMAEHQILKTDPQRYLGMMDERIQSDPANSNLYFQRQMAWDNLGRLDLSLVDLDKALALEEKPVRRLVRGEVLYRLGRYREAPRGNSQAAALGRIRWPRLRGRMPSSSR